MRRLLHILAVLACAWGARTQAGTVSGVVVDSTGEPVGQVSVVLCDQETGIPVSSETFWPFIPQGPNVTLATTVTDAQGAFAFVDVPEGIYRVIAQRWVGKEAVEQIFEVNGEEIVLHGVADNLVVPSEEAKTVLLKPLGTAVVSLDEEFPNNAGLLVISTKPLTTDPVLAFASWKGPFLQNLIGGNRMPKGVTRIHGLPAGRVYLSIFAMDNNGGIGAAHVDLEPGQTVRADYIPIVCGWSNGRHDPPEELAETFTEIKAIAAEGQEAVLALLDDLHAQLGITAEQREGARDPTMLYGPYFQQEVTLPSARVVPFKDVLASLAYLQLQKNVERRRQRAAEKK